MAGKSFSAVGAPAMVIALLALGIAGCSSTGDPAPPDAAATECDMPDGVLDRLNLDRQLVLNLALAEGANLEDVQSLDGPEPDTFRAVADVLDDLDLSGVEALPSFDTPDDIVADLRKTADLLDAALAAGIGTADPAWQALAEFYTQGFFVRHNASLGYYLDEAGCV